MEDSTLNVSKNQLVTGEFENKVGKSSNCDSAVVGCCIVPLNLMAVVVRRGPTSQTEPSSEAIVSVASLWCSRSRNPSENTSPRNRR